MIKPKDNDTFYYSYKASANSRQTLFYGNSG
jgi:hypothetical protein